MSDSDSKKRFFERAGRAELGVYLFGLTLMALNSGTRLVFDLLHYSSSSWLSIAGDCGLCLISVLMLARFMGLWRMAGRRQANVDGQPHAAQNKSSDIR